MTCVGCNGEFFTHEGNSCKDGNFRCKRCANNWRNRNWRLTETGKAHDRRHYETRKERASKWCKDNKERANANVRKYSRSAKGKEVNKRKSRKRYWADPEYYRKKAIARNHGIVFELYEQLLERQPQCQLCGSNENLTLDHIHPVSRGGKSVIENLQILCLPCNSFKSNRLFLPDGGMIVSM